MYQMLLFLKRGTLGGHFECLCWGFEKNGNTLIIFIVKSPQKEQIYYYDPQSAGINLQSPQSDSTPWTITLMLLAVL